jgi:hypothetical protein
LDSRFVWDVAALAPGERGVITLSVQISPTFTGLLTNTAAIASGTGGVVTDTGVIRIAAASDAHAVYLPMVMTRSTGQPADTDLPDLVVQEIAATRDSVQILITNQGAATVTEGFWVDVYIDPTTVPTAVNQVWSDLGDEGLVWGVKSPMKPEDTFVLTVGDSRFRDDLSQVAWPLAPGTPVYAQVDSWSADTTYGAVLEDHEHAGAAYANNIDRTTVQRDPLSESALIFPKTDLVLSDWIPYTTGKKWTERRQRWLTNN